MADFSASDSDDEPEDQADKASIYAEEDDDEIGDGLADSYISRESIDETADLDSVLSGSVAGLDQLMSSTLENFGDADDEDAEDGDFDDDGYSEDEAANDDTQVIGSLKRDRASQPQVISEDVHAEVITGVRHLSVGRNRLN